MKYVMTSHGPIAFSDSISHVMFKELEKFDIKILSAGFAKTQRCDVRTFDKAASLDNMRPHEEDARTLEAMLIGNTSTMHMLIALRQEDIPPQERP